MSILHLIGGKETAADKLENQALVADARAQALEAEMDACTNGDSADDVERYVKLEAEKKFALAKARKLRKDAQAARDKDIADARERETRELQKRKNRIIKKTAERVALASEVAVHASRLADTIERLHRLNVDIATQAGSLLDRETRAAALLDRSSYRNAVASILRSAGYQPADGVHCGVPFKEAALYSPPSRLTAEEIFETANRKIGGQLMPPEVQHAAE
ncbi:MAG: hypothetical protein JSR78_15195 [Proteobacteria bacterium]|nr:hypothetical protein [Pseudomonadota bacterium]